MQKNLSMVDLTKCKQNLKDEEITELKNIICEFNDGFAFDMKELTGLKVSIEHEILTDPNEPPVRVRPYRISPFEKQAVDNIINEMNEAGIITESNSPTLLLLLSSASPMGT